MNRTKNDLQLNIKKSSKTTLKLSVMFLRMKETKSRIDKRRFIYEKLCHDFSNNIKEQADLLRSMSMRKQENSIDINSCLKRISQLLCENTKLRLKLEKKDTIWDRRKTMKFESIQFLSNLSINSNLSNEQIMSQSNSEITIFKQHHIKRSNSF